MWDGYQPQYGRIRPSRSEETQENHADYKKLCKAFSYLRDNKDCYFILTNQDATYPTAGSLWPGSGAMSYPLVYASKREPTVIGKPNKTMMDAIIAESITFAHPCFELTGSLQTPL